MLNGNAWTRSLVEETYKKISSRQIEHIVNTFIQSRNDVLPVMEGARPVLCSALISVRNAAKPRNFKNNHDNSPDKCLRVNW